MQKDPELSFLSWFLCHKECQTWKVFLTWGRSLPVLHHNYVSRCVGRKFSSWPRTAGLMFYCLLTGLCLTLVTLSGPKPDLGLSLFILAHVSLTHITARVSQNTAPGFPALIGLWLLPWHLSAGLWREAFLKWGHERNCGAGKGTYVSQKKKCRVPSLPTLTLWKALW